ncbi:LuxR C-terminal-related transcriptional regulator [Pseudomonas kribbensis]|uniref:LuxR C-terminal-related transcriptional regulator n=1 Tax=Pseudomonas kribbensis TaxID=1628086 RepID=UPI001F261461|nr:LuxR C-terminal-related transcriptional regulator [Pseudomonas kribbensis]UIN57409.1 LuxR C-terminal-related transcriptional regulator [Pseudomonas kribbensis]
MTAMTPSLDRPDFLPRLSPHHLPRPRLCEALFDSTARVKLICAPAGSGKTALLTECLLQAPANCTVCWLPLAGAALGVGEFCERLARAMGLTASDEASLLYELARRSSETWVLIDDYCRNPQPALDALLDRMLAISSPAVTWWIGTRRRPPCNWPRLLLDDALYECEGAMLALTRDEIAQLLRHLPPDQADSVAARIHQRSGGWCAGVRMLMMQKCDWSQKTLPQQRMDTLLDYLQHELFSGLSPELAEAWRVLAHLPRFNASLCDHLFGAGDGAQWMRNLQTLGCFIEPWRGSPDWLQVCAPLSRLMRDEPWPAGRSWHRRACQWFAAGQHWKCAFEQALLAEEYEVAVSLLQHFSFEHLFEEQTVVLLLRLYEQRGEELLLGSAQLVGLITAALLFAGRFVQAADCIGQLSRFLPPPSAGQQRQLIARWQAQQGWLLHLQGRMEEARDHFEQALSDLSPKAWTARLLCLSGRTQQALLCGDLELAHSINREALCLARAEGSLLFEALLELDHAQVLEQRGGAARAEELLANLCEMLGLSIERPTPLLGRIALRRGRLALSLGQQERAAEFFQQGLDDCLRSFDKRVLYGFLGLAQLAADQGDFPQAFMRLRDAERLMQQRQIPDTVYRSILLQVSSEFWLQQGRPELAREALTRVIRHFRGPNARQAPPATLELVPRIECLLILAETRLHQAPQPMARLQRLFEQARSRRMILLEAELLLAMGEVASLLDEGESSRLYFERGRALASHFKLSRLLLKFEEQVPDAWVDLVQQKKLSDKSGDENSLSLRESQVLELIASGNSNQQIADKLFISLHTVKTHVRRIHAKLGVERRTHAVARARMLGLCS